MENGRDTQWERDYQQALADLSDPHPRIEPQLLLPAPARDRRCPAFQPITKPPHPFDPDNLADVLSALDIKRTVNPQIRDVVYLGMKIGQIAKSPYVAMCWVASCDRRTLFYSQRDAALRLVMEERKKDLYDVEQDAVHYSLTDMAEGKV